MSIARYTFLPWLRRGAANAIAAPATASSRAMVGISLALNDGTTTGAAIAKTFQLIGPGDIVGINPDLVVRTEPKAWVTDFEPNYLPFIDFYDEDFPWRHTPDVAGAKRLMPWLTLIVLAEGEFEHNRAPGRPLTSVVIKTADPQSLFPPDDQLWAWAHVQIAGTAGGAATAPDLAALDRKLASDPDSGVARLLSPRRLQPNTAYTAFVIPTFETGRKAGLGIKFNDAAEPGLTLAWRGGANEFPVYYEWYFRTGEGGDFEDLVQRLEPRTVDPRVGIRDMDIADPGFGMPQVPVPVGPGHHEGVVGLEGALKSPTMVPKPLDVRSAFPVEAAPRLNAPAEAQAAGESDPVVAPPIYGGWHALLDRVDPGGMSGWVDELNLDPRQRAAGGLGARVVRQRQEDYMKIAWQQVGEIVAANRKAHYLRFAQQVAEMSYVKHLAAIPSERFVAFTAPVFPRVLGSPVTLKGLLAESRVPPAALSPAIRKLLRPRGLLARRALPPDVRRDAVGAIAAAINDGRASAAPPLPPPGGPTIGSAAAAAGAGLGLAAFLSKWGWWIVLLLILLAIFVFFLLPGAVGLGLALALAAAAAGVALATVNAQRTAASAAALDLAALTPQAIPSSPPTSFGVSAPGSAAAAPLAPGDAVAFGEALVDFAGLIAAKPAPKPDRPPFDIVNAVTKVKEQIRPAFAYPRRAAGLIRIGDLSIIDYARRRYAFPPIVTEEPRIVPVMAYPDLKEGMYKPLSQISDDLLVPNLGLIPPNSISLMLTNPPFIESYMAGLNHEFMRELLWREYPTDQRGSPFRQFWDVGAIPTPGLDGAARAEALKDIKPLHTWPAASPLGSHDNRPGPAGAERIVLVIRGDLLKRYPNTIIYAQDAVWSGDSRRTNALALYDEQGVKALANIADPRLHYPIFRAAVAPDLTFIGFDAGLETVRGHPDLEETAAARAAIPAAELGWFFVLQEVVGETRFGLDENPPPPARRSALKWDNLSWENVAVSATAGVIDLGAPLAGTVPGGNPESLAWSPAEGGNAADLALILNQKPVLVAIHGREMLARGSIG